MDQSDLLESPTLQAKTPESAVGSPEADQRVRGGRLGIVVFAIILVASLALNVRLCTGGVGQF